MVRMWSIGARFLDQKGLGGAYREAIQCKAILEENRLIGGHIAHPQLDRFRLPWSNVQPHENYHFNYYLHQLYSEGCHGRGYNYKLMYIGKHNPIGCPDCIRLDDKTHAVTPLNPFHIPTQYQVDKPHYYTTSRFRVSLPYHDTIVRDNYYKGFINYKDYADDVYPLLIRTPRNLIQYSSSLHNLPIETTSSTTTPLVSERTKTLLLESAPKHPTLLSSTTTTTTTPTKITKVSKSQKQQSQQQLYQIPGLLLDAESTSTIPQQYQVYVPHPTNPILTIPPAYTPNQIHQQYEKILDFHFPLPKVSQSTKSTTTTTTPSSISKSTKKRSQSTSPQLSPMTTPNDTIDELPLFSLTKSIEKKREAILQEWKQLPISYKAIPVTLGQVLYEWKHIITRMSMTNRDPELAELLNNIYIDINYHHDTTYELYKPYTTNSNDINNDDDNNDSQQGLLYEKHPYETQFPPHGLPAWLNHRHPNHKEAFKAFSNVPPALRKKKNLSTTIPGYDSNQCLSDPFEQFNNNDIDDNGNNSPPRKRTSKSPRRTTKNTTTTTTTTTTTMNDGDSDDDKNTTNDDNSNDTTTKKPKSSLFQIKPVKSLPADCQHVLHINDLLHPSFYIVDGEIEYTEVLGDHDLGELKLFNGI